MRSAIETGYPPIALTAASGIVKFSMISPFSWIGQSTSLKVEAPAFFCGHNALVIKIHL